MTRKRGNAGMWIAVCALALGTSWSLGAAADEGITGTWVTEENKARVTIVEREGVYSGKIDWLEEPDFPPGDPEAGKPKRDRENPDKSRRDQPVVGLVILSELRAVGDGKYEGGSIYDPENGKTYKCKMELREVDRLSVRGFLGFSLLGRTTVWTRYVPPDDSGDVQESDVDSPSTPAGAPSGE